MKSQQGPLFWVIQ